MATAKSDELEAGKITEQNDNITVIDIDAPSVNGSLTDRRKCATLKTDQVNTRRLTQQDLDNVENFIKTVVKGDNLASAVR